VGDRPDLDHDRRGQASIFVTVNHCSTARRKSVGIHAARRANRFGALEPLRQGVRACFGAFAEGVAGGLKLRHDHGSQFVADDYQRELAFLGFASSPAFVREPEGNGYQSPAAVRAAQLAPLPAAA
jgi:putative transposase